MLDDLQESARFQVIVRRATATNAGVRSGRWRRLLSRPVLALGRWSPSRLWPSVYLSGSMWLVAAAATLIWLQLYPESAAAFSVAALSTVGAVVASGYRGWIRRESLSQRPLGEDG